MSDEEHQFEFEFEFESKANAVASKTYPQQASTISKGDYIVIKNRPCKVIQVSTIRYGRTPRCHFVALDIFNQEKLEYTVPSSYNCDVPHVICTDYMLHKATDGSVLMLSEDGYTKVDIKLLNCSFLMTQINRGFRKHRELAASVISAMGEEHICAIKDLGMIKGYYHPSLLL